MFPRLRLLCALFATIVISLQAQQQPGSYGFRKVGSWPGYVRGNPRDIVVLDKTAFIAMGEGGLCIVDVTSRANPQILGRLDLPGEASRIEVEGNHAYIAAGTEGVFIVNIANPAAPTLAFTLKTGGNVMGLSVAMEYLFVANGPNGLIISDITNPAAATIATNLPLPGIVYDVEAEAVTVIDQNNQPTATNRFFQVVNGTNGFLAYRMTNAFEISEPYREAGSNGTWDARAITRFGRDVYWAERGFVSRFDFTRPFLASGFVWFQNFTATTPITKLAVAPYTPSAFPQPSMYLFNGSASYSGRYLEGAVGPASRRPADETAVDIPGDGYEYFLDIERGLTIYQNGTRVSSTPIGGSASKIVLGGDRLYVADGALGIQTLKTAADGALTFQSTYSNRLPRSIDVANSNLFILGSTNIEIVNVENAAQPALVTNITQLITNQPTTFTGSIAVNNNVAYVGAFGVGLSLIDVTNPATPRLLRKSLIGNRVPMAMSFSDTNIFAAELSGLISFAISPDSTARVLQNLNTGQPVRGIALVGSTVYLCDRANGLKIYDVSDAANMILRGTYNTPGSAYAVAVSGSFAFVADQDNGILVINVSDPTNPTLVATLPLSNSAFDLVVRNNRLYVAHGVEGVSVWDLVPKQAQTLDFPPITDKTVRDLPLTLAATASSGLPVTFNVVSGPATIQNGKLTLTGAGSVTVRATQAGNDEFAAVSVDRTFNVTKATQTITFAQIPEKTTRSEPFLITATSDSGLPVRIFVVSGPAEITGGIANNNAIVTTTGPGTVTIRATQAGDAEWLAAANVERTFTVIQVARDQQIISMPPLTDASIDDDPINFAATSSSGLPLEIVVSGPAVFDFGAITLTGLGEVTVSITEPGNRDYAPVNIQKIFTVRDLASAVTANVLARNPNIAANLAAPDADPDNDGLPNIVEYILRSDPTSATSMEGHTTATIHESGGARYLKAHYLKPRTSKYPIGIQVADFADYPFHTWISLGAGFNEDGTGDFLWPLATYRSPIIRLVVRYP
jgi:hypothetical protein